MMTTPPRDRVIYAVIRVPVRWLAYKPTSDQARRGVAGRWQSMNEFGGWTNLHPNKPPAQWEDCPGEPTKDEGSNLL